LVQSLVHLANTFLQKAAAGKFPTLVAVAAMAAVTGAMADATIYGVFDQAYRSDKVTVNTNLANTKKGIDGTLNGGNALGFKGSEDLGDGLKASFLIEFGMEASDGMTAYKAVGTVADSLDGTTSSAGVSNGVGNRQSHVSLAGGFGSVTIGKQYSEVFGAAASYDLGGAANMVGSLPMLIIADDSGDVRRSNQINYKLPSLVPGLSINIGKSYGEDVKIGNAVGNKNAGDGTNYSLSYATGPFAATMASETLDNAGVFAGAFVNEPAASTTTKKKTTVTGLSYDAGVAKIVYSNAKATVGAAVTKGSNVGVSIPFGAASVAYQSGTGETNAVGVASSKTKASMVIGNYSLSKRTTVYLRQGAHQETLAGANTVKVNTTALGINHGF
jgi:predicted porin